MSNHPQAAYAAEAAQCAGEQGQYWEMHNQLFAQPDQWDTTREAARASFQTYADVLNLNNGDFLQCLDEGRYTANVEANMQEARRFGLTGTPSFIINGKLLVGAHPTETFVQILDQELEQ